jgi:hypothetical protein
MTDKKQNLKVERRTVAKVINVQPPRPADDLFNPFAEAKAAEAAADAISPPTSSHLLPPPTTSYQPTAPAKDFTRVFNSVTRDAIPAGLFKGNSKKVYDVLYLRTRGARVPARLTKIKHSELMELAKVSHNTLRGHLRHLEAVGLVVRKMELGDNSGATYEVFVPEELPPPTTSYHPLLPPSTSVQELGGPSTQILVGGGGGQVPDISNTSSDSKTSFKTNTERDDDEAFARMFARLREAVKDVTGRESSAAEAERWEQLAELLVTELKIAAGRTDVSSVPAFLTEHLRRRLWKKDKRQIEAEGASEGKQTRSRAITGDVSKCPDCYGTGMWYPEGYERGVARCAHEKLRPEGGEESKG